MSGKRPRGSPPSISLMTCCLSFLLALQSVAGATPVTMQTRLTEPTISLGESTTLELHINGLRNPEQPDLTHPALDITKVRRTHSAASASKGLSAPKNAQRSRK